MKEGWTDMGQPQEGPLMPQELPPAPAPSLSKGKGKGKGKGKVRKAKPVRPLVVSPGFFGSEVRRLVLRAFTEEPEEDPLTVPQALYAATMRSIPYIYEPKGSSFDVMPILPVSTLFSDDELDELQLKRKKRKDPRQTIVSVPSIRLMPGLAHPLTFNEEQMLRLFVTDPRSMAYNLSNTQRSRVPLTVEQCEMAHRIIECLEDPNNPTRKVMRHHLGGFYALALPDEGSAQAIAAMDYATPHRLGVSGIRMLYTPSSDNFPALHVNMHHILADNDALMTFWQESFQVQELLYYGFSKEEC
eukprot:g10982.t1